MIELVDQVENALGAGAYMPALMVSLTLPDICGALASDNGRATGSKYRDWMVASFRDTDARPASLDYARLIYDFRCSLLHQGSAHPQGAHSPVAFIEPAGRPTCTTP